MSRYRYLLDIEEHFYITEHPFNPRVVKVKQLGERIADMEEELEKLREEFRESVKSMRNRSRIVTVRRAG